jgi:hypothetical protein
MAKSLKWVTFVYELFISIPLVGGLYLFPNRWLPMLIALVLHIGAYLLLKKENLPSTGNLFGIVASILGVIPIMVWIVHWTTVFLLLIEIVVIYMFRNEPGLLQE